MGHVEPFAFNGFDVRVWSIAGLATSVQVCVCVCGRLGGADSELKEMMKMRFISR